VTVRYRGDHLEVAPSIDSVAKQAPSIAEVAVGL
jgi:hypothetical protein